jgi:hypothetical protein
MTQKWPRGAVSFSRTTAPRTLAGHLGRLRIAGPELNSSEGREPESKRSKFHGFACFSKRGIEAGPRRRQSILAGVGTYRLSRRSIVRQVMRRLPGDIYTSRRAEIAGMKGGLRSSGVAAYFGRAPLPIGDS